MHWAAGEACGHCFCSGWSSSRAAQCLRCPFFFSINCRLATGPHAQLAERRGHYCLER